MSKLEQDQPVEVGDVPEASEKIRVVTGTVTPEVRDRLLRVRAGRFLKYETQESIESVVQVALEAGLDVLERDLQVA